MPSFLRHSEKRRIEDLHTYDMLHWPFIKTKDSEAIFHGNNMADWESGLEPASIWALQHHSAKQRVEHIHIPQIMYCLKSIVLLNAKQYTGGDNTLKTIKNIKDEKLRSGSCSLSKADNNNNSVLLVCCSNGLTVTVCPKNLRLNKIFL